MSDSPYLISFKQVGSAAEGLLTSTQFADKLPFAVKRVFWIQGTPAGITRGHHANKTTKEVLVALTGTIKVKAETEDNISEFTLSSSDSGLYIPALCWTELTFTEGTIALCLASTDYDETDYLRDYDNYKKLIGEL
ncbi:FdtA/QdtA family cupin domain-containing protein [Pontibacter sp. BT310]|uniref:FdtA/QdtA family cupin domain-containing protein n=1 Tax=Pontibacter populi TaxID=890055 RepID=A0ABS6X6W2_9BACT|nr:MULTISPECIES: FdtA/QdtA family cupin domain-containing protein [Pontibacter]MBJ6116764.1 FdtA/QdtA family cupin domain-containing protein [Pontibacter sp. BT310]MBR0569186.1 FdtA/QdtA family cupin domain-containing protein [Microvirga sp. STS03]MBW3363617.1 FdtA/QdtA family cupin domain-containing protein [Pontibacter populi]